MRCSARDQPGRLISLPRPRAGFILADYFGYKIHAGWLNGFIGTRSDIAITSGLWMEQAEPDTPCTGCEPGTIFKDCTSCPEMVVLPLAVSNGLKGHQQEKPVQNIIMDKPLAAGRYETTFEVGYLPFSWRVKNVSTGIGAGPPTGHERAFRCLEYTSWPPGTGYTYRLPSEANGNTARAGIHQYWWVTA